MTKQSFFIAIDGHGGSGKSTLAYMLAQKLNAEIIQVDDFTGMKSPEDWHKLMIKHVFAPIKNGATLLNYPRAKWWIEHHPEPMVNQKVKPIMILEGVGSLSEELRPYVGLGIFVDAQRSLCLERGFIRDRGMDGMSDEEVRAKWEEWLDSDDVYFAKDLPKEYADISVDGTKPFDELLPDIESLIATR